MTTIDQTTRISEKMAISVMSRYTPEMVKWHYEHGLVLQSIYAVGTAVKNPEYHFWVKKMYDTKIFEDGTIDTYRNAEFNLDQINPGKTLFDLFQETGNIKYKNAIETLRNQLREHPRTESGGFWHKQIYPYQMWLDGLYMAVPFYARYAALFGTDEDMKDVVSQLVIVESKTRNPETGLLQHAWDESRQQLWADTKTGRSPHVWARAMGWYCMALVDTLDWIPNTTNNREHRDTLISIVQRIVSVIVKYQDRETGLWFQVMDQCKRDKNYLESSASSMFVYFLFKSVRLGYCSDELSSSIRASAWTGYEGLVNKMITEDEEGYLHLQGVCKVAGLGGNPYRDGSFNYYIKEPVVADDFKGVGPFIYASLEAEQV